MSNPLRWPGEFRRIRRAAILADWLHNLALFSSQDFAHFDEESFWQDGRALEARHPGLDLGRYLRIFEARVVESGRLR